MLIKGHLEDAARKWLRGDTFGNYKPYSWVTAEIHISKAAVKSLLGGRRGGKTQILAGEAYYVMEEAARTRYINPNTGKDETAEVCRPGVHMWIGGPNNSLLRQFMRYFTSYLPQQMFIGPNEKARWDDVANHAGVIGEDRRMSMRLRMRDKNGRIARKILPERSDVIVEFKSARARETFQSGGLDFLGITEAQDFPEESYKQALPALNSPGRLGKLFVEGIPPESNQHWSAKLFEQGAKDKDRRHDSFRIQTFDNTLLNAQALRSILDDRGTMTSEEWDRTYLALLPSTTGSYFRNLDNAEIEGGELAEPMKGRRYVGGLDTGRLVDKTVFVIMDSQARRAVHHLVFQDREDYQYQLGRYCGCRGQVER